MLSDLYSPAAGSRERKVIGQARINAARRLLDCQLRASYYTGEWDFSLREWLGFMSGLLILGIKLVFKRMMPMIEDRNDRWHHRSVLAAAERLAGDAREGAQVP
jgi:hypothetical protein